MLRVNAQDAAKDIIPFDENAEDSSKDVIPFEKTRNDGFLSMRKTIEARTPHTSAVASCATITTLPWLIPVSCCRQRDCELRIVIE